MRKFWKIFGISLGSVLGVVLVAVAAVVYVVFTPNRLTPVVDKVAGQYLTCDYELGQVDLTFFSTFPEFGLHADHLLILNPTEGAQSDTLLAADKVVARFELMQLLEEGCVNIRELTLENVALNAFIGENGQTNYDIIHMEPDTTTDEDTTSSFIRSLKLEDVAIAMNAHVISLCDRRDPIDVTLRGANVALRAHEQNDTIVIGALNVALPQISANYKGADYLTDADIRLNVPYNMNLRMKDISTIEFASVELDKAKLQVNQFDIDLRGRAMLMPTIDVNIDAQTNPWQISELLAIVPEALFTMPKDITADGIVTLGAHAEGVYNDSLWPLVNAHVVLEDATGSYAGLPYTLTNLQGDADVFMDLGKDQVDATLNCVTADVKSSQLSMTGNVTDIMDKMLLDLDVHANLHLPDADYFFPEGLTAKGKAVGDVKLKITLDDLAELRLTKGKIGANIAITNLDAEMDSMQVKTPKANLVFHIPNTKKADATDKRATYRRSHVGFLDGCLKLSELDFAMMDGPEAQFGETDIDLQVSDILNNSDLIYADLDVETSQLNANMQMTDSTGRVQPVNATLTKPAICGYVEYDAKDTIGIPTLACDFRMQQLEALYDTINVTAQAPEGNASVSGGRRDKSQPRVKIDLKLSDLAAKMGSFLDLKTNRLGVKFNARHSDNKENILLEWSPKLDFDLEQAVAKMDGFEPTIHIPQMKFEYSNKDFMIDTSRIELGSSDFSLSGEIKNIGPWLENKGLLIGRLNFISTHANVDELLAYTSGIGNDEETDTTAVVVASDNASSAESEPYLVPKGVDFTLNTMIKDADAFGQHIRNVGGGVYVKDGVLIIEEMGFVCRAAKLQLTALYKTPRRNHLFVGLDYHMTDIDVEELVDMIPQVDSMLPMLRSFKGAAQFHLAAETYLNSQYEIKPSTTRGAMSITAKDLTLLDGETFSTIAKILTFKKKTENKIDSISAEVSLYKQEIDIYPFLITCDKWMAAVGGEHNLDMSFDYHISLLNPIYLGVDVSGTFDDLKIRPAKCRYAQDFKPVFRKEVDTQAADIRKMIKQALEKNLK